MLLRIVNRPAKKKKKVQLKMMGQTFESEILFLTYILCDKSI